MTDGQPAATDFASSTGQVGTSAAWQDDHFEACRAGYEQIVHAAGFLPDWHVLDAGCGMGNYLPWLAHLVGPGGRLSALDLAPENVATVERRLADWRLPCPAEVRRGTFLALPYPDGHFDALWCANATQYLTDEERDVALLEFRRVVRPGGLVALMGADAALARQGPGDPFLRWRLMEAVRRSAHRGKDLQWVNLHRGEQRLWLRRAGLEEVRQRPFPIEVWAPLAPAQRAFSLASFRYSAAQAEEVEVSEADRRAWRALANPDTPGHPLADPDFHWCETHVLTVGRVLAGRQPPARE